MHAFIRKGLTPPAAAGTRVMVPCPSPAHIRGPANDESSASAADDCGTPA